MLTISALSFYHFTALSNICLCLHILSFPFDASVFCLSSRTGRRLSVKLGECIQKTSQIWSHTPNPLTFCNSYALLYTLVTSSSVSLSSSTHLVTLYFFLPSFPHLTVLAFSFHHFVFFFSILSPSLPTFLTLGKWRINAEDREDR
jgi:hypothetical protein